MHPYYCILCTFLEELKPKKAEDNHNNHIVNPFDPWMTFLSVFIAYIPRSVCTRRSIPRSLFL